MNNLKTVVLLALLTGVLLVIGNMTAGRAGLIFALVFAAGLNFFTFWYSDKIVLKMYRARPLEETGGFSWLRTMVSELAAHAGLPEPKIYIMPIDTPNAFATGRNPSHSAVAFTSGILSSLDKNELRGVIAHELSHIKHSDILISTVAATIAGAIGFLASMARWAAIFGGGRRNSRESNPVGLIALIVAAVIAPIAAMLIQMAISRSREFEADREAALLSGNPHFLINALKKLTMFNKRRPLEKGSHATAHLFIVNPFNLKGLSRLFSTHPPMEERIKRLENIR